MARRPCIQCGRPTSGSRCSTCPSPGRDPARRRANYGAEHQRARRSLGATLPTPCWYGCGRILSETDDWVAAHEVDGDPHSPRQVTCRACNEQAKVRP